MTREIPLTRGYVALVDDADFEWLSQWKWTYTKARNGPGYAVRFQRFGAGVRAHIKMHRAIVNPPDGFQVDHINRNSLDNRRSNLRIATTTQNNWNHYHKLAASGYRGVHWSPEEQKWYARIQVNGHRMRLGYFRERVAAAHAYDQAAREHFGEFAYCNFEEELA